MKRKIFSLMSVLILVAVATYGFLVMRDLQQEPMSGDSALANAGDETVIDEMTMDEMNVPGPTAVPGAMMERQAYGGYGGGGGGYGAYGGYGGGPFVGAELTLKTRLPEETTSSVYAMPMTYMNEIDLERVQAFAAQMGVSGDMYFEWYPGLPVDGRADEYGNMPSSYRIFDGEKRVMAFNSGELMYENTAVNNQFMNPPLPFAERVAIAESFAQEHNLLDFPYQLHESWGYEVQFLILVDNKPVNNWAQLYINVTSEGEVSNVTYRPLTGLNDSYTEELRSAQSAWEYVQANFENGQIMYNLYASDPAYYMPGMPVDQVNHWERKFEPGQEVSMNSWMQMFRPADGSSTPYLLTDRNMRVLAPADTLEEMATAVSNGNVLHLEGTITGERGNLTINVSSWSPVMGSTELYLTGTTRQQNGRVYLELPGGFQVEVANPPADLPIDKEISMTTTGIRPADNDCGAITEWLYIDLMYYSEPAMEMAADPALYDPFLGVTNVEINSVDLVYQYIYPYESMPFSPVPYAMDDNAHLIPMWRFGGETNKGDTVEFIVPAPASIELPTFGE